MYRTIWRLSAALIAASLVAIATPAYAHVNVDSDDATPGGFGVATFRVPNESDTAATTKVTVTLPSNTPFAFVSAESKPGWTVSTTTEKLNDPVTNGDFTISNLTKTITWTATGDGIASGEYDTFGISGGPFPDVEQLILPTTQTYADGEVVAWDQKQVGDSEPERPVPTLTLTQADDSPTNPIALSVAVAAAILAAAALVVTVRQNRRRA